MNIYKKQGFHYRQLQLFTTTSLCNSDKHFYQGLEISNDKMIQYTDYLRLIKNTNILKVKTEDPKPLNG